MNTLSRYLLPGLAFQSVVIGGGYATGRELIEFFMPAGPMGGLLGMAVTMTIWGVVMAVSLELARVTRAFDYRAFFRQLLGPGWILFEAGYVLLLILVLSVLAAACNEIVRNLFGWPAPAGAVALMIAVGLTVFRGSAAVGKALAGLGLLMYAIYFIVFGGALFMFGDRITEQLSSQPVTEGWFTGGLRYAGYNLVVLVAVLFCADRLASRREAVIAGLLTGPIALLPGVLFFTAMMAFYPDIGTHAVPSVFLVQQLGIPGFATAFQLAVFGTLVATGAGLLHAVNERAAGAATARGLTLAPLGRILIAVGLLVFSAMVATRFGLIDLVAKGYGLLTWFFIAVIVLPVMTVGIWRIRTVRQ
jgi:uncharacterized membrane protein YkvI